MTSADELVEAGHRGLAIDRDAVLTWPRPPNIKLVEGCAEERADIVGSIREVVSNA
jgi:hypothetical protein